MASVRMTNDLRETIKRNSRAAHTVASPRPAPSTAFVQSVKQAILQAPAHLAQKAYYDSSCSAGLYHPDTDTRGGAPHGYNEALIVRTTVPSIELYYKNDGKSHRPYDDLTIQFPTQLAIYGSSASNTSYGRSRTYYIEQFLPEDQLLVTAHLTSYKTGLDEWATKKVAYDGQILDLLNGVTTLKQMLEIWPGGESLVPSDKLQQLHVKVTRLARAKEIADEVCFDASLANQTVLTAKMLGG